jgi:hypothetical protein
LSDCFSSENGVSFLYIDGERIDPSSLDFVEEVIDEIRHGFVLKLNNGNEIVVRWGYGFSCKNGKEKKQDPKCNDSKSPDAEIYVFSPDRHLHSFGDDNAMGFVTPKELISQIKFFSENEITVWKII